jgi:hypothetical protein
MILRKLVITTPIKDLTVIAISLELIKKLLGRLIMTIY